MINNRQNGRRRGRGGQPQRNGLPGAPDRGNRLDNRARGNANQLHEKYKTLARDAQMQGDRVNTEYYLQFADHYFRVLNESRARFEEQRRPRDDFRQQDEFGDDGYEADDDGDEGFEGEAVEREERRPRFEPRARDNQPREGNGDGRGGRDQRDARDHRGEGRDNRPRAPYADQPAREEVRPVASELPQDNEGEPASDEGQARAPRQPRRRERSNGHAAAANGSAAAPSTAATAEPARERIEIDRLPPALSAERTDDGPAADGSAEAEPRPRRRTRRPRAEAAQAEV